LIVQWTFCLGVLPVSVLCLGHTKRDKWEGRVKEGEYGEATFYTKEYECGTLKPVEITIRRGLR
jgi:hypothetical protein